MSNNLNKNQMSKEEMERAKATAKDAPFTDLKSGEVSPDLPAEQEGGFLAKVKRKASRIGNITLKDIVKAALIGGAVAGVGVVSYKAGKKKGMSMSDDQDTVDADYTVSDSGYDDSVYDAPSGADDTND